MRNYNEFLEAKSLIKRREYKEAIIILRKLYDLEPDDRLIKFELARVLTKNKKSLIEGKRLLEELLSTPSHTYAKLELGKLEASEGNIEKARSYFEELLTEQNKNYAKSR